MLFDYKHVLLNLIFCTFFIKLDENIRIDPKKCALESLIDSLQTN